MHFFKFVFAFLSVGGATYAFIKLNETPAWLKAVSFLMAAAAVIIALPELPRGIDAIGEAAKKIAQLIPSPSVSRPAASTASSYTPPSYDPPAPTYTPPQTYTPPAQAYVPPASSQTYTPPAKCAALVMAAGGGYGISTGSGTCSERLERARNTCNSYGNNNCGAYATSRNWVAGVHCVESTGNGRRWNSFVGLGDTESEAFQHAFNVASQRGFGRGDCHRKVSISSSGGPENRYN